MLNSDVKKSIEKKKQLYEDFMEKEKQGLSEQEIKKIEDEEENLA